MQYRLNSRLYNESQLLAEGIMLRFRSWNAKKFDIVSHWVTAKQFLPLCKCKNNQAWQIRDNGSWIDIDIKYNKDEQIIDITKWR